VEKYRKKIQQLEGLIGKKEVENRILKNLSLIFWYMATYFRNGWQLSPEYALVRESFKKASRKIKEFVYSLKGIIFHQDQGSA